MKWSKYNYILPNGGNEYILYNCGTDRIMVFVDDLKRILEENMSEPKAIEDIHSDLYGYLLDNKFIVEKEFDEIADAVDARKRIMESEEYFGLTLNPTLNCNLRCWYCYEKHQPDSYVTDRIMSAVKALLKNKAESETIKHISLNFFGGEPLLKFRQTIAPLIEYTDELCKANNKTLSLGLTTNAVLLSREVTDWLATTGRPVHMQIPFDGGRKKHNEVKKLPNGKGTYDLIIDNIKYAVTNNIFCKVRCNYSLDNSTSFRSLVEDFKDFAQKNRDLMEFTFHQIWQSVSKEKFTNKAIKNLVILLDGYNIKHNYRPTIEASRRLCYADRLNEVVVNYNGDIYKCTARDFVPERCEGILNDDGTITYNELYDDRIESAFTNTACMHCSILPICTTCTQKRLEHFTNQTCVAALDDNLKLEKVINRIHILTGNTTAMTL